MEEDQGDGDQDQAITRNRKRKHENNGGTSYVTTISIFRNMILRGLGVFATREQVYAEHRSDIRWVVMCHVSIYCHYLLCVT